MKQADKNWPILAVILVILVKIPFLLTHHIQEDAFITWRVAQNLMDYGVIGFNGEEKISSSTTHMYMFMSWLFNVVFGKEAFMYPILIFNSLLFTIGSWLLSKMLFKEGRIQAFFIVLFGLLPPAIKISILGMEYGLLFLLEMSLLYYGFYRNKNWALVVFPPLIMFTRIDTVIFLGIVFLVKLISERRIYWNYVLGGILGLCLVLSFNQLYFNEWVNNTIVAKKTAYRSDYSFSEQVDMFIYNFGHYFGMLKLPVGANWLTSFILILEAIAFFVLVRKSESKVRFILTSIFIFGWVKQLIFLSQRSYFDWYYWVPQLLLFVPILVLVLQEFLRGKKMYLIGLVIFFSLPMIGFQAIHSIATGNGEWNYRRQIGLFLNDYEKDKNQWILLEPAGFVPYFSKLKTIDEVGLVDKGALEEIKKDRENYWVNIVKNRKPKYILAYQDLENSPNATYYAENYEIIKEFRIAEHFKSDNALLEKIYKLKPSGRDYTLYQRKK